MNKILYQIPFGASLFDMIVVVNSTDNPYEREGKDCVRNRWCLMIADP